MMNPESRCEHEQLFELSLLDRLTEPHRSRLIQQLDQVFPHYPAEDIIEVIDSSRYRHAYCPTCDQYLMRVDE